MPSARPRCRQEEAEHGQGSLFGDFGDTGSEAAASGTPATPPALPPTPAWSESERLQREKELLGFYISGHPLDPFRTECELFASHTVAQLGRWTPEPVTIGVVVTAIKRQVSKRSGAEFARLTVEDFSGSSEVLVFPEAWAVIAERVRPDVPLLHQGRLLPEGSGGREPDVHRRVGHSLRRSAGQRRTRGGDRPRAAERTSPRR